MIKVTNIQATRLIGALLILLSGNAFAVTYATQPALDAEKAARIAADTAETTRATKAEGALKAADTTETARATKAEGALKAADTAETARATKAEGALKAADTAETARAKVAEGALKAADTAIGSAIATEVTNRNAAIAVETARAKAAELAGAGTKIADGTHTGDTLVWNGSAWTPVATEPVYILGDIRPDGGIVYYVDGSGHHGLAAQPNDEAGVMNWTDAMAAAAAHNNPACPTDILRTPTCWHLPTKTELEYLYEQQAVVGGFVVGGYWSSTETFYTSSNVWVQGFNDNGAQGAVDKAYARLGAHSVQAF